MICIVSLVAILLRIKILFFSFFIFTNTLILRIQGYCMNISNIHAMIHDTETLKVDTDSYVAQNLLCCVLELAKCDGGSIRGTHSGYFWEKMDKALKEMGYTATDNQHCIISKQKN